MSYASLAPLSELTSYSVKYLVDWDLQTSFVLTLLRLGAEARTCYPLFTPSRLAVLVW
jgi:hypothetical protein